MCARRRLASRGETRSPGRCARPARACPECPAGRPAWTGSASGAAARRRAWRWSPPAAARRRRCRHRPAPARTARSGAPASPWSLTTHGRQRRVLARTSVAARPSPPDGQSGPLYLWSGPPSASLHQLSVTPLSADSIAAGRGVVGLRLPGSGGCGRSIVHQRGSRPTSFFPAVG